MSKIKLPKELTTVTPLSKFLALLIFLTFPIYGFLLGAYFQHLADLNNLSPVTINYVINPNPTPTPYQIPSSTITCKTNTDCPPDYLCAGSGPIIFNPGTGQTSDNRTCLKNGTPIAL